MSTTATKPGFIYPDNLTCSVCGDVNVIRSGAPEDRLLCLSCARTLHPIVNTPTPEERASEFRDIAYRIDAVRYSENLSGVGQNQLYLVWLWLGQKADELEGKAVSA